MGAITMEMKELNKNVDTIQERQKQIEKINEKKEQEKEYKQYKKDLLLACENDVKDSMDRVFEDSVSNSTDETLLDIALYKFYDVNIRNEYINTFGKTEIEKRHIDQKYDKILKQVYNKWKNHIKNNQMQELVKQQEELKKQQEQAKSDEKFENICKAIGLILKWILIIIFAPITLLILFISMCAKGK